MGFAAKQNDKHRNRMTKKEIAIELLDKFPDMSNHMAAKKLHKDNPGVFPNTDMARTLIRAIRGANGNGKDGKRVGKGVSAVPRFVRDKPWQASMPKSTAEVSEPVVISGKRKVLILSDIHFPFHDEKALLIALEHGIVQGCDTVVLNGDTIENYGVSRWEPDPRKRDLQHELQTCREGLAMIREAFPEAEMFFKFGNHDDRLEAYLKKNAPLLLSVPECSLESLLKLDELKIKVVRSKQVIKSGHLLILHGHELPKGLASPVCAAKRLYDRLRTTSICGHFHQHSNYTDAIGIMSDGDKKVTSCWTTGCLCDLSPEYAISNNWTHGFAIQDMQANGDFILYNHMIIAGKVH